MQERRETHQEALYASGTYVYVNDCRCIIFLPRSARLREQVSPHHWAITAFLHRNVAVLVDSPTTVLLGCSLAEY